MFAAGIFKTVDLFSEANVPTLHYVYNHTGQVSVTNFFGAKSGMRNIKKTK